MAEAPKMVKTKTPGVYKRGNRYAVVYRDAGGTQHKEAARTYDDARRLKAKREAEVSTGEFSSLQRITLHDYATSWVETYAGTRADGISDRTRDDYRRDLNAYALAYFSPRRPLVSITTHDVQKLVTWLMDEDEQERALTSRTVKRILAPLSACYTTAKRQGIVRFNPVDGVGVPRRTNNDGDDDGVKVLTRVQLAAFLLAVPTDWRLFFETMATTGARWSEVIAWEWRDFNPDRPSLRVARSLYKGKPQPTKSKFSRRSIPLSARVAAALFALRTERDGADDALIFPARNGAPLRQENVRRRVLKPAAKQAGVPWMGFHTLRHTAASLLFARNDGKPSANLVQVQRFLGHHSPAFTLATYVHLLDDDLGAGLDLAVELGSDDLAA